MRSGLSERAGRRFERIQTKRLPSLEESPLQVLEVDISGSGHLKLRAFFRKTGTALLRNARPQRIERAGMLPARFCASRNSGRQGLRTPDTSRAIRPLTRMAGYPHLENK